MTAAATAGLDLPALQRFFDGAVPGAGPIRAELLQGGRSNLTYRITDGRSSWVLRRPPLGGWTPSAHDMAREYRVVAALHGSGVPVARPVALHEAPDVLGVPFSLVEHVDGRVIRTPEDLSALTDSEIDRCALGLVEILARLHAVDPAAVGLAELGRPHGYLARQIRRWHDQWKRVATRDLTGLDLLHDRLAAACPPESGASIVHGDFRIDNVILDARDAGTARALIDWEMATLGDPLADLGLHIVYGDPACDPLLGGAAASTSPRMPSGDSLIEHYCRASGRAAINMPFYIALGYFKSAVIAEGIHARHAGGLTVGAGFDTVGTAVPDLVEAGLAALTR